MILHESMLVNILGTTDWILTISSLLVLIAKLWLIVVPLGLDCVFGEADTDLRFGSQLNCFLWLELLLLLL